MKPLNAPPQVSRLVVLLLVIIGTYAVARHALTPPTFGQYGHYRGAALTETAAREPRFGGAKACDECHSDAFPVLAKDKHRTISCEACHGALRTHAKNPDVAVGKVPAELCVRCHVSDPARPSKQPQIVFVEHNPGEACTECHLPHQPNKSK